MLPSRGALQSLSSARSSLTSRSLTNTSNLVNGHGRRFGTSTRLVGAALNGRAGVRPGVARSTAAAAVFAGSLPSKRDLSFNFWSRGGSKPEAVETQAASEAFKPETTASTPGPVAETAAPAPAPAPVTEATPAHTEPTLNQLNSEQLEDLWQGQNISDLPERIGYLKDLGLDFGWGPSSMIQWMLEHVYIYTGLPWWATIAATTIALRLALLPSTVKAQETQAKMQKVSAMPEYIALKTKMTEAMGKDQIAMNEARMAISHIHKQNGVNPLASFWGLLQLPIGYGTWVVLSNMAKIPVPSLETGGLLWFTDLTVADPFYILPVLGPLGMILMLRSQMKYAAPQSRAMTKLIGLGLAPISFLVALWLPAGVQFYFAISTVLAYVQNAFFHIPLVRNRLGLPPLVATTEPSTPSVRTTARASSPLSPSYKPRTHNTIANYDVNVPKEDKTGGYISRGFESLKDTMHSAKGGMGNRRENEKKTAAEKALEAWEQQREEQDREAKYGKRKRVRRPTQNDQ